MREIKFRGLIETVHDKKWVYGYLYKVQSFFDKQYQYFIRDEHLIDIRVDETTIGQYTGIKSKNGKEIYEGDIIKVNVDNAIVKYSDDYSGFILEPIGEYYFDSPMLAHNVEYIDNVIGNIYENPELLKEREN